MMEYFNRSGNIPCVSEILRMWARGLLILSQPAFIILLDNFIRYSILHTCLTLRNLIRN
jgi:hypothetical protein